MFGLQGAAIQGGIAQGLNQAGSSLLNASALKKRLDTQDAMQRRLLAVNYGWERGRQPSPQTTVRPARSGPGFEQQVGNFNLPAFAPAKDFGETSTPSPRLAGADLLARLEE